MLKPTRLTKRVIDALPTVGPKGKRYYVRDTAVRGLMIGVNRLGSKSWKVQRDIYREGKFVRSVRTTIGQWPDMDVDAARARAQEVITQIKRGIDPNAPPEVREDSVLTWTLERLYKEYEAHMRKKDRRDVSIDDMQWRLDTYLPDWKTRKIATITKADCKARHELITANVRASAEKSKGKRRTYEGKRTANMVMSQLKWAFNYAAKQCEDDETLPANPVDAVTLHKVRGSSRSLHLLDMPEWWTKVHDLPNPLRRQMHILGLLSGLRPGTLVAIRRQWIDLKKQSISIPDEKMKSDKPFALPLSNYMCELVRSAIAIGDMMFPGSHWLFPTRSNDGKDVIATQVWKEKSLPSETGHILRHTYRTIAETTTIQPSYRKLLLDHTLPGMDAIYVDKTQLFCELLAAQEVMTDTTLKLCKAKTPTSTATPAEAA